MPISGVDHRLMRAALGRQREARRRRHQHEARVLVAGVVQRIEAARDEGIVERADRQQPRAELRLGETQRRQQQEEIVLGDAELDMPAVRRAAPISAPRAACARGRRRHAACGANTPDLIDPAAEIGRDRDVGRGGDDARGEIAAGARDLDHDAGRSLPASTALAARASAMGGIGSGGGARLRAAARAARSAPLRGRRAAARRRHDRGRRTAPIPRRRRCPASP